MRDRWYFWCCAWAAVLAAAGAAAWPGNAQPAAPEGARVPRGIRVEKCQIKLIDEVTLSFERAGTLGAISVREGDEVHEGQLLANLKDDVARAALAVAEAEAASDIEIRYAQKASEVAQVDYEKMQEANRRVPFTVPELEIRKARLAADKAVLETEKAVHTREIHLLKRDEAATQLETYRMPAPFDGFVTRVHLSKGAAVRQGDPVIELVSTKKVKVEGEVAMKDLGTVRPGAKVVVQLDAAEAGSEAAGKSFPGKIVFVDVKSLAVAHTVRVWAEVENVENALRAGLNPTMTVLTAATDKE